MAAIPFTQSFMTEGSLSPRRRANMAKPAIAAITTGVLKKRAGLRPFFFFPDLLPGLRRSIP